MIRQFNEHELVGKRVEVATARGWKFGVVSAVIPAGEALNIEEVDHYYQKPEMHYAVCMMRPIRRPRIVVSRYDGFKSVVPETQPLRGLQICQQ